MIRLWLAVLLTGASGVSAEVPSLDPGDTEWGVSGSFLSVEGNTVSSLDLRGGGFWGMGPGLGSVEVSIGYRHLQELDHLELGLWLGAMPRFAGQTFQPYLALGVGTRQEWIGSFQVSRVPIGAAIGTRALVSSAALIRLELRWTRVLNDPVAAYTETLFLVGVSILRN